MHTIGPVLGDTVNQINHEWRRVIGKFVLVFQPCPCPGGVLPTRHTMTLREEELDRSLQSDECDVANCNDGSD
jgi:hypothetical protein